MASKIKMALANVKQLISAHGIIKGKTEYTPFFIFEWYLVQISKDLNICVTRISIFKNLFPWLLQKQSLWAYVTKTHYPTGVPAFQAGL